MAGVNISVDVGPLVQYLTDLQSEQIPFAVSRAINDLALEVQTSIQEGMKQRFIIRRDWVLRGVKISHFSSKKESPIHATVEISPDRYFLPRFEDGGTKTPRSGPNLAVPTDSVRGSRQNIIPGSMRPKAFGFQTSTTKRGATQIKGNQRTFIIPDLGIFQRTGPKTLRLLYRFFKSVPIPMSLHFHDSATKVINARFVDIFRKRLAEALATAK